MLFRSKKSDADEHFATRYATSCARTQLATLDPLGTLRTVPDLFIAATAGGKLGVLDIPCGAGAVSADLLATVAMLRQSGVCPRTPLQVSLVAGDISQHARSYASKLLDGLQATLNSQAIFVETKFVHWDVTDPDSTTNLLHTWMKQSHDYHRYLAVLANFSGFLEKAKSLNKVQRQLDCIFQWAAARRSAVIWLEPQTNAAVKGFFPKIADFFAKTLPRLFRGRWEDGEKILRSQCRYLHPIKAPLAPRVGLSVIRLEVTEGDA